jgi:hypothetical protein
LSYSVKYQTCGIVTGNFSLLREIEEDEDRPVKFCSYCGSEIVEGVFYGDIAFCNGTCKAAYLQRIQDEANE